MEYNFHYQTDRLASNLGPTTTNTMTEDHDDHLIGNAGIIIFISVGIQRNYN